jgi:hypothetical protein
MARLFGWEYHEHSNSWYYQSSIYRLGKEDVLYKKYLDEQGHIILEYKTQGDKARLFPLSLKVNYDPVKKRIKHWKCQTCGQPVCRHYLSIIDFAYHNMTTEELLKNAVQTYGTELLEYDEFWQQTVLNGKIEISEIYNNQNNKIRFYFSSYKPLEIRLISILAAGGEIKDDDRQQLNSVKRQMQALSQAETDLLAMLYKYKCSYSRKGVFFTIYKTNFRYFFNYLQNLRDKVYIRETGEHLEFSQENLRLNFNVVPDGGGSYVCRLSSSTPLSAVYVGNTTWFIQRNKVWGLQLPFKEEVSEAIFNEGFTLQREDLVYFSSVVARQLGLIKCYIDFDEAINLPEVYHSFPQICFSLRQENEGIIMHGSLKYSEQVSIPMSVINLPVQLARFDQNGEETWFYIPPQIKNSISQFFLHLPAADENRVESHSELVFTSQKSRDELKKAVFEYADQFNR